MMIMYVIVVPLAVFVFTVAFLFRFDYRKYFRKWRQMNQRRKEHNEGLRLWENHRKLERLVSSAVRVEDHSEDLVPGLPNVITLDLIVPKLPWRAFHRLSSVSRCRGDAIRGRQVYDARVRSHSTETLLACEHWLDHIRTMSLYSMKDDCWHPLPQLPCARGIPKNSECISLDGRLYLIGGVSEVDTEYFEDGSRLVYVLDLVEQKEWKQCASMKDPRTRCSSGVVGGKIFVFGGWSLGDAFSASEMYDAKEDVWSSIQPMKSAPVSHTVLTVGGELFVCDGHYYADNAFVRMANGPDGPPCNGMFSEVYNPERDEWRLIKPFGCHDLPSFFTADGEIYGINCSGIRVTDVKSGDNSWRALHSRLFPGVDASDQPRVYVAKAYAINGEVIALLNRNSVIKSRGFRSGNADIVWEHVKSPQPLGYMPVMCPIRP